MTEHTDADGDSTTLTEHDQAHMLEEIEHLDAQLENYEGGSDVWNELTRQRRHLLAELEAGRRLPLQEEDDEE